MQAFCVVMFIAVSTIRTCVSRRVIISDMATHISTATLGFTNSGAIAIWTVCF